MDNIVSLWSIQLSESSVIQQTFSDVPQVSWILCTYREDDLLHRAIDSCLSQEMSDFELLLVVNGPESTVIVPRLKQRYLYDSRVKVLGTSLYFLNFSLSFGIQLAKAPLVARMDADDISYPERLKAQLYFMHNNPDVSVCGSNFNLVDENDNVIRQVAMPLTDARIRKRLFLSCPLCHPTVIFRKSIVCRNGGYIGNIFAEDYDLWCRLAQDPSIKFANIDSALLGYRIFATGEARRSKQAYAATSATQWMQFVLTGEIQWLLAAMLSAAKRLVRSG